MSLIEAPRVEDSETVVAPVPGRVTLRVASVHGFCHGVERAVRTAREAIAAFPDRRIFLTSEIVHHPGINQELRSHGVRFLSEDTAAWRTLGPRDVIILPAFGVAPQVRERVVLAGCHILDTTCGEVMYVWKSIDRFAREGLTTVYHGRRGHEEAIATLRRLELQSPPAPFFLLENLSEARLLAEVIAGDLDWESLQSACPAASSPGFDPRQHLERIGLASQTTMLARETVEMGVLFRRALAARHGEGEVADRFHVQETICTATQDRQDALAELLASGPDLTLVVGGFSSSNTAHLAELAARAGPAFHIEGPEGILSSRRIWHRVPGEGVPRETGDWLPGGPVFVGITSGASTPENVVEAVIHRLLGVGCDGSE